MKTLERGTELPWLQDYRLIECMGDGFFGRATSRLPSGGLSSSENKREWRRFVGFIPDLRAIPLRVRNWKILFIVGANAVMLLVRRLVSICVLCVLIEPKVTAMLVYTTRLRLATSFQPAHVRVVDDDHLSRRSIVWSTTGSCSTRWLTGFFSSTREDKTKYCWPFFQIVSLHTFFVFYLVASFVQQPWQNLTKVLLLYVNRISQEKRNSLIYPPSRLSLKTPKLNSGR